MKKEGELEVIEQLEKIKSRPLQAKPLDRITSKYKNGYYRDAKWRIVGLNLDGLKGINLSILAGLPYLSILSIRNASLEDISSLKLLKQLEHLNLSENQIKDVSPLASLTKVVYLNLHGNQLIDISPLARLTKIKKIYLGNNKIIDISPLKSLSQVEHLSLGNNKIIDISHLSSLTQIRKLYLGDNKISDVSPLATLTQIEKLRLDNNDIIDASPLASLAQMQLLDLNFNNLNDLSALATLKEKTSINISNNRIRHLPKWICSYNGKIRWQNTTSISPTVLSLSNNPLETPPIEVVKQGKAAIINYFDEMKKATVPFLHAKMLLVGQGEVGKTTVMKKLMNPDHKANEPGTATSESTTEGIDIQKWSMNGVLNDHMNQDITIHFWDFGGQEIYHATHQFFLTKRSLYLFIWDARKEEEAGTFNYWLEIVKLLGQNSPVIMVMNKSDVRIKHIDEKSYKENYPNIHTFLKTSCLDGTGFDQLQQEIRKALNALPHLSDKLPAVWVKVREALTEDKRDFISLDEYYRICATFDLNEERADFLSDYLHDLGVILHFRHDKVLENTVILKPQWATDAVYKLIDTKEIIQNNGSFLFDDLKKYWDTKIYPRSMHVNLIRLMERFELCFNYTGSDHYFVPELLPPEAPDLDTAIYTAPDALRFQYHYPFMPEGIISRFISRLSYLINNNCYWKYGVELMFEQTTALVRSEPQNNRIRVGVSGNCKQKLLGIIQTNLEHIHETLNMEKNTNYHEMIPCICPKCKDSNAPHMFNYDVLTRRFAKNKREIPCLISDEDIDIETLLKGFTGPRPKKSLKEELKQACVHLLGLKKTIKEDEDSRTGFIRTMLSVSGFDAREQARWGQAGTGKSPGRVDLLVTNRKTGKNTAVEAFNLKNRTKKIINDHLKRVFYYDPLGEPENYILVYSSATNFNSLWKRYLDYISHIDFTENKLLYEKLSGPDEEKTKRAEIKHARTIHLREGEETTLHHIFINMNPKEINK